MVWAVQYDILYVCECICVGEGMQKRERWRQRGEIDKQSESKGVAQSEKLNLMNEPSSEK